MATTDRTYYRLIFPENLEHTAVDAFVANVGALPRTPFLDIPGQRTAVVFEVWGDRAGIHHRVGLPTEHAHLIDQLRTASHGLHVEEDEGLPLADFSLAHEYGLTSDITPLDIQDPYQTAAAILTSLQPLGHGEVASIQWVVSPSSRRPPRRRLIARTGLGHAPYTKNAFGFMAAGIWNIGSAINDGIQDRLYEMQQVSEYERQKKIQQKWQGPVFTVMCRIGIRATSGSTQLLHSRVVNALQATTATVRFRRKSFGKQERIIEWTQYGAVPLLNWPCFLNGKELSALLAFPIGSPRVPGLHLGGSYQAPPPPNIPADGRVLARSTYGGIERPLAVPWTETLRHVYTVGSTGSGKTTLLENCAIQDMERGAGLVYIDPKGDSAQRLIQCIPPGREKDVIYFDPANKNEVVGLNLFAGSTENPNLATDNIVGMFKKLYKDSWGHRLEATLRGAVRTLAPIQYITLLEVTELLTSDKFRNQILQHITVSPALQDFWKHYNALTPDKRAETLSPIMNKLQAFGLRDEVRHVIGQSVGLNMKEVIAGNKIVIANLSKGELGADTTALLGSTLMLLLWQSVQRRPEASRKIPFYGYVDECQDFLHLPTPLGDMLAQARGYGFGLTLANQHLEQLDTNMRHDILSNTNSFAYFRLSAHDAGIIAKQYGSHLEPKDFMNLGQYEIITSISTGGHMRPKPTVGTTYPQATPTGSTHAVQENTHKYAYPCVSVDEDIIRRRQMYSRRPDVGSRPL